jgi:formyl-CoA transferase/CoA:oxalate CoA-transferase
MVATPGLLSGIRVLDLSRILAGPFCTMALADLGAEVIKVEPPGGDDTRHFQPPLVQGPQGQTRSGYFLSVNRGKKSLAVDLKKKRGLALIHALAKKCDVVVQNYRPGVAEKLGVGAEGLLSLNPLLVVVTISGYGRAGLSEYSRRPGYDVVMQAVGGIPALTGPSQGAPYKVGVSLADLSSGMAATQAVLAGLFRRERQGKGLVVDLSMQEVQLSLLTYFGAQWLMSKKAPTRHGNAHPSVHPYGVFSCSDGDLIVAVANDKLFRRFAELLQNPHWAGDARFSTNPARVENREALDAAIAEALKKAGVETWLERFFEAGIPAAPLLDVPDALEHPQIKARGLIVEHEQAAVGAIRSVGSPIRVEGEPRSHPLPPPEFGAHTREILGGLLGHSAGEIDDLEKAEVVFSEGPHPR